jgi:hypothetical protein
MEINNNLKVNISEVTRKLINLDNNQKRQEQIVKYELSREALKFKHKLIKEGVLTELDDYFDVIGNAQFKSALVNQLAFADKFIQFTLSKFFSNI